MCSALNFVLSLNIPLQKLFGCFRRPQLWVTGDWQLHHNNVPTHASHLCSFLVTHQITKVTQFPYSWDLAPCDSWFFPKVNFRLWWDSGKYKRETDGNWENCVRFQGVYFERDWGVIVLCTIFLVSSLVNVSIFYNTWLDTFWTGHFIYTHTHTHIQRQRQTGRKKEHTATIDI